MMHTHLKLLAPLADATEKDPIRGDDMPSARVESGSPCEKSTEHRLLGLPAILSAIRQSWAILRTLALYEHL